MTVSAREAFKLGFVLRCAEEGLSPEQIEQRIKRAADDDSGVHHFLHVMGEHLSGQWDEKNPTPPPDVVKRFGGNTDLKYTPGLFSRHPWLTGGALAGAAIGLPILGGIGLGHLARKLEGDFLDPDDMQKAETTKEMEDLARRSPHSQSKALGL